MPAISIRNSNSAVKMLRVTTGVCLALLAIWAATGLAHASAIQQGPGEATCSGLSGLEAFPQLVQRVLKVAENQAFLMVERYKPDEYPTSVLPNGTWEVQRAGHWMCGFFPGVLWQLHALTGKQLWADKAQLWQQKIANNQREFITQHDFGFIYMPTFAHSYSVTGSNEDKRQALAAAEALSWAFNPNSQTLRTFEAWMPKPATHWAAQIVIVDFMMNIQMLVWGAQHVGPVQDLRMDANPSKTWMDMAVAHARKVAANHVRPDGSTYHIVEYNPFNGGVNRRYTYQGHADNSTWSRGQAWAMAGFSMLFEATDAREFRDTAIKVTNRYLQLLDRQERQTAQRLAANVTAAAEVAAAGPEVQQLDRWVPMWDFDAPYLPGLDGPRDTSGGAVAALGLLHLAKALAGEDPSASQRYLCAAHATLRALATSKYMVNPGRGSGEVSQGLLKHATGGMPLGLHIDVGLITADYYFLEALATCNAWQACREFGSSAAQ